MFNFEMVTARPVKFSVSTVMYGIVGAAIVWIVWDTFNFTVIAYHTIKASVAFVMFGTIGTVVVLVGWTVWFFAERLICNIASKPQIYKFDLKWSFIAYCFFGSAVLI